MKQSKTSVSVSVAENAMKSFSKTSLKINEINNKISQKKNKIDEDYSDQIKALNEERDESFEVLQNYAQANPDLFTDKKSIEIAGGKIGYRTGNNALKTLKGWTWEAVLNVIKKINPAYVTITENVAKAKIIENRELLNLEGIGVQVIQEEKFYAEAI